jgi:hypothetical protein
MNAPTYTFHLGTLRCARQELRSTVIGLYEWTAQFARPAVTPVSKVGNRADQSDETGLEKNLRTRKTGATCSSPRLVGAVLHPPLPPVSLLPCSCPVRYDEIRNLAFVHITDRRLN